jgi:hypothetical protein
MPDRPTLVLPEITYPLVIDTLGKLIVTGHSISIHCNTLGCHNSNMMDLEAVATRLGVDHSCGADDLLPHFHCRACRAAGRPDRNMSMCLSPGTALLGKRRVG